MEQKVEKQNFDFCLIDLNSFLFYDIAHLLEKVSLFTKTKGDIVVFMHSSNELVMNNIEVFANIFKHYGVLSFFCDNINIAIINYITKKNRQNYKFLIATNYLKLMQFLCGCCPPDTISFFSEKSSLEMSHHLGIIMEKGYEIFRIKILTKKEGSIKKLLKASSNTILNARKYNVATELEEKILSKLPIEMSALKTYILNENLMQDIDNFKKLIASLAINNKIKIYKDEDKIILEPFYELVNEEIKNKDINNR